MNPALGLFRIKDLFTRQTQMRDQCEQLLTCLPEAIAATESQAPVRKQGYLLKRNNRSTITPPRKVWREPHWEEAVWRYWRDGLAERRVAGVWDQIVSYQVMLRESNQDEDWGEVDLLGRSALNLPVVIELKSARCTEVPLRFLVEAAAYGIALRKAWAQGGLAAEWVGRCGHSSQAPDCWPIFCAAPSDYWRWCRERTALRDAWSALRQVAAAFRQHGLSAAFVELNYAGNESVDPLPTITGARLLELPS